jgi:hypothetical protein
MQKYGYRRTAACTLCQMAHEERGSSWRGAANGGRRRKDSVAPGERKGYKLDRAAWFVMNFLIVSFIDLV